MLLSGCGLVAAGAVLILVSPLALLPRIGAAAAWLVIGGLDVGRQRQAYRRNCGLRLDCEGRLELRNRRDEWRSARLLPGSFVLRHVGWIRVRDAHGRVFAEPLRGHCRKSHDWRRLQVLWRHVGAYS